MHYLVGDLQGCCDAFDRLLAQIGFSPSRDTLTVLGEPLPAWKLAAAGLVLAGLALNLLWPRGAR